MIPAIFLPLVGHVEIVRFFYVSILKIKLFGLFGDLWGKSIEKRE